MGTQKLFFIRLGVAEIISAVTLYLLPASKRRISTSLDMFRHNNFACGLCLSIVTLTATMCLYNVSRGDELIKRKKPKTINIKPFLINIFQLHSNAVRIYNCVATKTFPDRYLPTPLECSENLRLWCNKIFTLVPRLNPSLGFVTAQESHNTENKNKKRRRNLDSGALRPRVKSYELKTLMLRERNCMNAKI